MLALIKHTFVESMHKRMSLALMVISVLIFSFILYFFRFQTHADGKVWVSTPGSSASQPVEAFARVFFEGTLATTAGLWTILGIFALAPLLSSYLENGMAGLLFTKALSRRQIFLGRVGGALAVFLATVILLDGLPATYFFIRAGISPKNFVIGVAILMVSFLSLVAIMALATLQRNGPAPAIIFAFIQLSISAVLAQRTMLYKIFTAKWFQESMDFTYYVLPKNSELASMGQRFLISGQITSWTPLWSTAIFTLVVLGWSIWQLERKSL